MFELRSEELNEGWSTQLCTQIYDFIVLSRVYNEPIQRPAPSWLVSLIGRALRRYRRAQGFELQAWIFFQAFQFSQQQNLRT